MKRISLRRALSLRVGGGGTAASRNTEGYEQNPPQQQQQQQQQSLAPREAAGEGLDEGHRQKQQQPAMQQAPEKKAEMMNIDPVSSNAYSEGRGEDPDMPPQLAKLGENMDLRRDRRVQSSRVRPESIRLFEASASQSHHGVASRGVSGALEAAIAGSTGRGVGSGEDYSPTHGLEGPVPFQKMQKPAGWQEEQAVEIRRDWIAFLADGMGIDTRGATGADLEALVVRTMLEQAEDDLFQDSFDEWDTDEEEEEDRLHPKGARPEQQKGVAKGRRSRSHSRTRYLSSCADEDEGASSAASGGGGGLKAKRRQPRGGVLGSKLLRRSQTTGDMDETRKGGAARGGERVPVAKRNRRDASVQRREVSIESRGSSRGPRNMNDSRGTRARDTSTDSRSSFYSYSSKTSGGGGGGVERGGRGHRRKRSSGGSGSSSVLSVSSHESSRSRGSERRRVSRFDRWRDKLAAGESAREKAKAGEHHGHHHRDGSRNQGHAAAAAAGGRSSSRDAAAHGPGRGKAAGSLAPGGPPGAEADVLTSSGLLSVDPTGGGGGGDAGVRHGSGGSATAAATSGKGGRRSRGGEEGGRGGGVAAAGAAAAAAAAAPSPSVQLLRLAGQKGGGGGGGGDVAGFLDSKMSAAIEAAIFAANTSSGSFEASFSEDNVGGGRAAPANAAAAGGILRAAPTEGGGGSKSRWGLGVASSSSRARQHGGRGEDCGERPRVEASAAAVAAERLAKGLACEPRVATSSDGRGKQQSRQTVLFKTAAASTGDSGAAATAVPAGGGGGLSSLPRGGVDDPAPEDIARLGDRRPSSSGLGPAPPSSRGGTWADGLGRTGSSSRRPSIAPGPSLEEREEAAAPQEGEGGREEGELAREAVAAVGRAIANGSATAANGAIDEEALLAASMFVEAPTEEVGRGAANTAGTPFYTERTRGGGGGASHKSSRPSRRDARTKARSTGTDPARRGSHPPPPPADAHEARRSSSSARNGSGSSSVDASANSRSPPILAELSAVSGPSSRAKPRHRHQGREEPGSKRAAAAATAATAATAGGGVGSRSSHSRSSSDRKRAISAGGIGPDLRYEGAGGGSRGSSRDGGSGRVGGRGEPKPAGGQKPRGRSRERRGVVARNGTEAAVPGVERTGGEEGGAGAAAPGGVGLKRDSDSSRSVVQNTGAAAAAAAAADDGGYGSDWDKLEMHRAVYASDKPGLRLFMQARPQGLKQADHHGNTPLLLALKLGRTEMAWLMVRAGAELDLPSDGSFHLLDEAIVHGDEDLLVEVYGRLQRQSWARWRAKVPDLLSLLDESIPDFYMEMHWSFECSNVLAPIVKAVAPHDHYRIWKKGSWLRMDSTITGYTKRLKTQRGKVSLLFLGNDSPAPGTLIKLDHGKRKIYNVLRRLESPTPSEVRRTCRRYLSPGQSKRPASQVDAYVIKSSELNFKPVKDYSGKLKTGTVGPWACDMYECTGDMQLQAFRKGAGDNLLSGLSMKNYFDVRQTLEEKVMRAGGNGDEGSGVAATPSSGPGSLFNFGERSAQSQKAKMLAKLNTPHKRFEKKIKASMWMSQDFPLTLEHVTPMLEVLSMQDKVIHKLKEVLTTKGMREAGFPAKVSLPLYLGVYAAVTFDNCKIFKPGELEPELFLVKPDYSSSRRMQKGVFEGVMPGSMIIRPSAEEQQQQQPRFRVWQPSDGPGFPETPIPVPTSGGDGGVVVDGNGKTRSSGGDKGGGGGVGSFSVQTTAGAASGRAGGGSSARGQAAAAAAANAADPAGAGGRLASAAGGGPRRERGRSSSRGGTTTGATPQGVNQGGFSTTQPLSSSVAQRRREESTSGGGGGNRPAGLADVGKGGAARGANGRPWAVGGGYGRGGPGGEWEGGDSDDDDDDEESSDEDNAEDLVLRR